MKTDDLIQRMSQELKACKRLDSPERRCWTWLGVGVLCLLVALGLRSVIAETPLHMTTLRLLKTMSILIFALLAAMAAFLMSVPGRDFRLLKWLWLAPFSTWMGLLMYEWLAKPGFSMSSGEAVTSLFGIYCASEMVVMAIVPAGFLYWMLAKAAPYKEGVSGGLAAFAGACLAAVFLEFACPVAHPLHHIIWHGLPVIIIGGIGVLLGRWLLQRKS